MRILNFRQQTGNFTSNTNSTTEPLFTGQHPDLHTRLAAGSKFQSSLKLLSTTDLTWVFNSMQSFGINYYNSPNVDIANIAHWGSLVPLTVDVYDFKTDAATSDDIDFILDSTNVPNRCLMELLVFPFNYKTRQKKAAINGGDILACLHSAISHFEGQNIHDSISDISELGSAGVMFLPFYGSDMIVSSHCPFQRGDKAYMVSSFPATPKYMNDPIQAVVDRTSFLVNFENIPQAKSSFLWANYMQSAFVNAILGPSDQIKVCSSHGRIDIVTSKTPIFDVIKGLTHDSRVHAIKDRRTEIADSIHFLN